MEHIEQLKSFSPANADRFIMTAIRFYSEAIVSGDPLTYFTKLKNVQYPGAEKDREEEEQLAIDFIRWHDQQIALNTTELAGYTSQDELTPDQVDVEAKTAWDNSLKRAFGEDFFEEKQEEK